MQLLLACPARAYTSLRLALQCPAFRSKIHTSGMQNIGDLHAYWVKVKRMVEDKTVLVCVCVCVCVGGWQCVYMYVSVDRCGHIM